MSLAASALRAAMLLCLGLAPSGADGSLARTAGTVTPEALNEYRWFHAHPELSEQEKNTAAHLAASLRAIGLEVHEGIGGHGVVGILKGSKDGPVVLYRADLDGLPVLENTGLPYASENRGVMHACGHDVHMATAVGALKVLAGTRDTWGGTVLFVGQPAEEIGRGARAMLADPRWAKLLKQVGKPRVAVALHDGADLPAGKVAVLAGYTHANVDSLDIVIHGKGGHGARPEETVDPIVIAAEIVLSLQTIVSRRIAASDEAVVTVGKFEGGSKHNIIPPEVRLQLTVRSYSDETRKTLLREIERVAVGVAQAHGAPKTPDITSPDEYTPATYNDPAWTARLRARFERELGAANVQEDAPTMGGEDFGQYARKLGIPGVMWKLGAVHPGTFAKRKPSELPGLHSDKWAPDPEPTLRTGITTVVAAILEALGPDADAATR